MSANNNELISISHKIELKPNNKAKTHFKKPLVVLDLLIIGDLLNGKNTISKALKNLI